MSTMLKGSAVREIALGIYAEKAYTLNGADAGTALFTITGGAVMLTQVLARATTELAAANTVKLVSNPTVGSSADMVTATDIGTVNTPVGDIVSWDGVPASSLVHGAGLANGFSRPVFVFTGSIEIVVTGAGADGALLWMVTYVPVTQGAALAAA